MLSNKRTSIVLVLALVGILLTSCGGDSPTTETALSLTSTLETGASTNEVLVEIKLFNFQDKEITIPAGTRVTWVNYDNIDHSVTSGTPETPDGVFDSDFFTQDESFSMVFDTPGEYQYFCRRHHHMKGVVIVTAP